MSLRFETFAVRRTAGVRGRREPPRLAHVHADRRAFACERSTVRVAFFSVSSLKGCALCVGGVF